MSPDPRSDPDRPAPSTSGKGARPPVSRGVRILVFSMLVAVLIGGLGFVYKIVSFMKETHGLEGATFIVPVAIYACMALGFIFLLAWATSRGMFHDIEQPKHTLLEMEEEYDRQGI